MLHPDGGTEHYSPQVRTNTGLTSSSVGGGRRPAREPASGGDRAPSGRVSFLAAVAAHRRQDLLLLQHDGHELDVLDLYDSATSSEGPLPSDLYLGLALTSHDAALTVDGVMASFNTLVSDGPLHFLAEPVSTAIGEGANVTFYRADGGTWADLLSMDKERFRHSERDRYGFGVDRCAVVGQRFPVCLPRHQSVW